MRSLITVLAILAFATAAFAQSAGPPSHSVGDSWKRSNGLEITVVKADENGSQMTGLLSTCPKCITHFDKNLTILTITEPDGKPLDVTRHGFVPLGPDWRFLDFPLELKKTWRITPQGWFRGSPYRYTIDITVLAYEDVKTKAGTFKAFKLQQDWDVGASRFTSLLWYAPDVKLSVKYTTTGTAQPWEMVSYSLVK